MSLIIHDLTVLCKEYPSIKKVVKVGWNSREQGWMITAEIPQELIAELSSNKNVISILESSPQTMY